MGNFSANFFSLRIGLFHRLYLISFSRLFLLFRLLVFEVLMKLLMPLLATVPTLFYALHFLGPLYQCECNGISF